MGNTDFPGGLWEPITILMKTTVIKAINISRVLSECQDRCWVFTGYLNSILKTTLRQVFGITSFGRWGNWDLEAHHFVHGDSGARLEFELVLNQPAHNKCYQNLFSPPPVSWIWLDNEWLARAHANSRSFWKQLVTIRMLFLSALHSDLVTRASPLASSWNL